jgi:hypothetical protein
MTDPKLTPRVLAALQGATGTRDLSYRFERIRYGEPSVPALDGVLSASVEYNALADVKRTAKLTVSDSIDLDFLADRIRPWARLDVGGGEVVEWPLGLFVMSTPTRAYEVEGYRVREVECFDLLRAMDDDKESSRTTFIRGMRYTTAVQTLLFGITADYDIVDSDTLIPADVEFETGESKLSIANKLLSAINYVPAHFDAAGTFIAKPYVPSFETEPLYTYATDQASVITSGIEQTFDLFSVANTWVLVKSDPDGPELVGFYQNNNPASPTSTYARGRAIVDFRTEQDAADQATITAKAERLGFEASQVYEIVEFETAVMPFHGHAEVLRLNVPELDVGSLYTEHTWAMDLRPGARMKHRVRKVVVV